jgi:small subunit ribosomal protein S7e
MAAWKSKIVKSGGASADEFEATVAQELFNLEGSANELKADLRDLVITAAKEVELDGGRKAIIIFVPFRQLKDYHKIQIRLVRELEKKFRYAFPARCIHAVSLLVR